MTYQSFDPYSAWDLAIDLEATGKAWRRKRKERHLSQDGLSEIFCAADMPMSKAAISAVENGKHLPSIHHLFFFAGLCECQIEDLVITYRRSRESDDLDQVDSFKFNMIYRRTFAKCKCSSFFCTNYFITINNLRKFLFLSSPPPAGMTKMKNLIFCLSCEQ